MADDKSLKHRATFCLSDSVLRVAVVLDVLLIGMSIFLLRKREVQRRKS